MAISFLLFCAFCLANRIRSPAVSFRPEETPMMGGSAEKAKIHQGNPKKMCVCCSKFLITLIKGPQSRQNIKKYLSHCPYSKIYYFFTNHLLLHLPSSIIPSSTRHRWVTPPGPTAVTSSSATVSAAGVSAGAGGAASAGGGAAGAWLSKGERYRWVILLEV